MPAYLTVNLDTTPPQVQAEEPRFGNDEMRVPFVLNEPGVEAVIAVEGATNREIVGTVEDGEAVFALGGERWGGGIIAFSVKDAVWNAANYEIDARGQTTVIWNEVNYTLSQETEKPSRGAFTRGLDAPDPADLAAMYRQRFF